MYYQTKNKKKYTSVVQSSPPLTQKSKDMPTELGISLSSRLEATNIY